VKSALLRRTIKLIRHHKDPTAFDENIVMARTRGEWAFPARRVREMKWI
jgi:hypothetical protein